MYLLLCVLSLQVTHLLESHTYNVAVAQLMIFCNHFKKEFKKLSGSLEYHRSLEVLCTLLAPMAPHIASELWESLAGVSERSKPLVSSSVNKLHAYVNNYNYLKSFF